MSRRRTALLLTVSALAAAGATTAPTTAPATRPAGPVVAAGPDFAGRLYAAVVPSLVAVQYTFTGEVQQQDVIVAGIVVDDAGLVMFPVAAVGEQLPDEQLRKFKVIVPGADAEDEELDAVFQGRDERSQMAFVRVSAPRPWVPVRFARRTPAVGDAVYSVGLMPLSDGYQPALASATVSAYRRGPVKSIQVGGGGLSPFGSPVFDATGTAIGVTGYTPSAPVGLDDRSPQMGVMGQLASNHSFVPTAEFAIGLSDPPTVDRPVVLPFTGLAELRGLKRDEAAYLGLAGRPAIQVGDVLPDSPAAAGGIRRRDVIVTLNGRPLERGDTPNELPAILGHRLVQLPPGTPVTFGVLRGGAGQPPVDVHVTLGTQPVPPNRAKRFWADDVGLGVRELGVMDRYARRLKPIDAGGVVVTVLKPDAAARTGGVQPGDLLVQVNGQPTPTLADFKTAYGDFRTAHARDAVVVVVKREGREQTLRIEPPQ